LAPTWASRVARVLVDVNDRVVRVANVNGAGNTFELEGVDTTLFDTFSSGTAEVITFGTSITSATTVSSSGGGFDFLDTTTIHDNARSQVPGLPAAATFSMDHIWDTANAGQIAMKTASDAQAKASAAGAQEESSGTPENGVDQQVGSQRGLADRKASEGGTTGSGSAANSA